MVTDYRAIMFALVAGENISTVRENMDWMQPKPAATAAADPHDEHHHHMDMTGDMNVMGAADALAAARSCPPSCPYGDDARHAGPRRRLLRAWAASSPSSRAG